MKKLTLTITILLNLSTTTFADPNNGGLFHRGEDTEVNRNEIFPMLPTHNETNNQDATPLGTGIVLLTALGTAYLVAKKRRDE